MSAILLLVVSGLIGWSLRHFGIVERSFSLNLNRFIIFVSLPALTLLNIHRLEVSKESWLAVSMPWILFALNFGLVLIGAKLFKFSRQTTGALLLTAGLGNTSFIGFPLTAAYFGEQGLQTAILIDQPGTFLILALLGIPVAVRYAGTSRVPLKELIKRVIFFPPFIALLLALALRVVDYPVWVEQALKMIGWTLAPLALMSVGIQTYGSIEGWKNERVPLLFGLGLKLFVLPLIILVIYVFALGARGLAADVIVFEAAMAPMITASIVAAERGLNEKLCGLMLAFGIPFSLLSTGLWYSLLVYFLPS